MRSIEYLAQLFPDKTGKELLEIQLNDKKEDEKEYQKANKAKLAFIEDINQNGGYYKGRFGIDQRFFYCFTDLQIISGIVYGSVERITVFLGEKNSVVREGEIRIEKSFNEMKEIENYGLSMYSRIEKREYDSLVEYLNNVSKFWE